MLDNSPSIKTVAVPPRKNLSAGLMVLAVASSIIASTCCVLPLVLVLVGITGAWMVNLTSLRPITPFFTAMAIGTLLWAGVLVFRPSHACTTGEGPACETARPITKVIYLACAVFIGLLLLFPLIAPYFY